MLAMLVLIEYRKDKVCTQRPPPQMLKQRQTPRYAAHLDSLDAFRCVSYADISTFDKAADSSCCCCFISCSIKNCAYLLRLL